MKCKRLHTLIIKSIFIYCNCFAVDVIVSYSLCATGESRSTKMNLTQVSAGNVSGNGSVGFPNELSPLNKAINVLSIVILFVTMISLGCTMEIYKIKAHLLKPKGVGIALLAQFGVMPLTAFALAKALRMDPVKAVAVLICGCCPGGNLSNIFSLALKGDMNLR